MNKPKPIYQKFAVLSLNCQKWLYLWLMFQRSPNLHCNSIQHGGIISSEFCEIRRRVHTHIMSFEEWYILMFRFRLCLWLRLDGFLLNLLVHSLILFILTVIGYMWKEGWTCETHFLLSVFFFCFWCSIFLKWSPAKIFILLKCNDSNLKSNDENCVQFYCF